MNLSLSTRIPQTLLLTVGLVAPALAQNLTTFENGKVADATAVNANFTGLKTAVTAADAKAVTAQTTADVAQTTADAAQTTADQANAAVTTLSGNVDPILAELNVNNGSLGINVSGGAIADTFLHIRGGQNSQRAVLLVEKAVTQSVSISPEMIRVTNRSSILGTGAGIGFVTNNLVPGTTGVPNAWIGARSVDLDFRFKSGGQLTTRVRFGPGGECINNSGVWTQFSDARLKRDITPLASREALESLLALRGVTFHFTDDALKTRMVASGQRRGFVAQEVEQVFPDWVTEDEHGFKSVSELGVTALTVEALRELDANNRELRAENEELRQRVTSLEAMAERLAELERAMQPLLAARK